MRLWMMLALVGAAIGCNDSADRNLEKREMDRISYRNSELRRQVDDQKDRINQLERELQNSRTQIESLQSEQKARIAPPSTAPSTTRPVR